MSPIYQQRTCAKAPTPGLLALALEHFGCFNELTWARIQAAGQLTVVLQKNGTEVCQKNSRAEFNAILDEVLKIISEMPFAAAWALTWKWRYRWNTKTLFQTEAMANSKMAYWYRTLKEKQNWVKCPAILNNERNKVKKVIEYSIQLLVCQSCQICSDYSENCYETLRIYVDKCNLK